MENVEKTPSRLLTNSKKDKELKTICFDLFKLKLAEQEAKQKYAETQSKIKKYFSGSKDDSLSFTVGNKNYRVTDVNPTKINWDIEKLLERFKKRKVSKEIVSQVIKKTYTISDWNSFSGLLAKYGIKPDEVAPFLNVEKKVDTKKMNSLSDVGEILAEDVEGCYTVEQTDGYVKLTDWETKENEEQS